MEYLAFYNKRDVVLFLNAPKIWPGFTGCSLELISSESDKAENIRAAFSQLSPQVQKVLESLRLPYKLPDGNFEERGIELFLVGDTMFLSYFNGHQGPASSFPCVFCLIQLNDLKKTGLEKI
uniref:Uncharacterized protein n=1 Tax=Romanomermis culicivorax TaxID=13658 RepID=A0A915HT28_ROMCU